MPTEDKATALKRCDHCGSTATAMRDPESDHWWIECDGCGLMTPQENFGDPVKCWNTRNPNVEGLVAALEGLSVRENPKDVSCPHCFCNAWDWTKHTEKCKDARAALTAAKGE